MGLNSKDQVLDPTGKFLRYIDIILLTQLTLLGTLPKQKGALHSVTKTDGPFPRP